MQQIQFPLAHLVKGQLHPSLNQLPNMCQKNLRSSALHPQWWETGAVLEAKALLVNDSNKPLEESVHRNPSVGLPPPDEAASLLRMCLQCGVPKTYSGVKESMVCPLCGDRPVTVPIPTEKKRGSKVKDKEHSKRMKGQSTHSSWKSETEMHLRQQFD
jgi:hypothetical protein